MNTLTAAPGLASQTVDVSGLAPDAVKAVEEVVRVLRGQSTTNGVTPATIDQSAPEWSASFRAWCASQPRIDWEVDVSRDGIYGEDDE